MKMQSSPNSSMNTAGVLAVSLTRFVFWLREVFLMNTSSARRGQAGHTRTSRKILLPMERAKTEALFKMSGITEEDKKVSEELAKRMDGFHRRIANRSKEPLAD
jgi:hypothetical protein